MSIRQLNNLSGGSCITARNKFARNGCFSLIFSNYENLQHELAAPLQKEKLHQLQF
jgi:hypothetical protein